MTSGDLSYDRLAGRAISRCETHWGLCDRLVYASGSARSSVEAEIGGPPARGGLPFRRASTRRWHGTEGLNGSLKGTVAVSPDALRRARVTLCSSPWPASAANPTWRGLCDS